jgi:ATP-dependent helicase/nuclease subunit B
MAAAGTARGGGGDVGAALPDVAAAQWDALLERARALMRERGVTAQRCLFLVPYAQMMDAARRAWARHQASGFAPRFESSRNWAATLAPFVPGPQDVSGDMARDSLVADGLLAQLALRGLDAALRASLVTRVVEAAHQLAPLAAARPPAQRDAWAQEARARIGGTGAGPMFQWEGVVQSLAVTRAALSAYATDVLWTASAAPGVAADLLLVVPGVQADPLAQALLAHWGERGVALDWPESRPEAPAARGQPVRWHACTDAGDEAQRTAACVIARAAEGHLPVALVAQDRLLTRRVGALLADAGLRVRDETGWKLSTTHAAARVLALLRAADRRARTDAVLEWLKAAPRWSPDVVRRLERVARREALASWAALLAHPQAAAWVPEDVEAVRASLQAPRPLVGWLQALRQAMLASGMWAPLAADEAGQRVIETLRLDEDIAHELAALSPGRWSAAMFVGWVRDALEAASFRPEDRQGRDDPAPVVVLPMAQLLGRSLGAVVVPGCDATHLPASPEPPGDWSPELRAWLGLPDRATLAQAAAGAWAHLLTRPSVDLLWRHHEAGEAVLPAAWVQWLRAQPALAQPGADPRVRRELAVRPPARPRPAASDLLPEAISASAYQDLRDCPYRFFALRQLRLRTDEEIELAPDKRDQGNWLHAVLRRFHETREAGAGDDARRLDALAWEEARRMGLVAGEDVPVGEDGAMFLPFLAAWPALRDGYLAWLRRWEAGAILEGVSGVPRFEHAELSLARAHGPWRLVGTLDRIDRVAAPDGALTVVLDYKTEPRQRTQERVRDPFEDTQIAFYAALLGDSTAGVGEGALRAGYLSITDARDAQDGTRFIEQPRIAEARDRLLAGLAHDLARIAAGHPMPALGEARACEYCAARGLCRRDFWAPEEEA